MDIEDRDHFRTIAEASVVPWTGSEKDSGKERSSLRHDHDWYVTKARAICGCYRRDEAQDPDIFSAALAVVLEDFPVSVVEYAADPRTGVVTRFQMGLPNIGQIKGFLDDILARQQRVEHYSKLPRFKAYAAPPLRSEPNLFVPNSANRYDEMVKRHEKEKDKRAHFATHVCQDGQARNGIWVPLDWWESTKVQDFNNVAEAGRKFFERECAKEGIDPSKGVSPALLKTIREQENIHDPHH